MSEGDDEQQPRRAGGSPSSSRAERWHRHRQRHRQAGPGRQARQAGTRRAAASHRQGTRERSAGQTTPKTGRMVATNKQASNSNLANQRGPTGDLDLNYYVVPYDVGTLEYIHVLRSI